MKNELLSLIAFAPILFSGVLLVGFRLAAKKAMPLVFVGTCLIAYFLWGVSGTRILASTFQGLIISIGILWIIIP